jgi:hypothetical protein
MFTGENAKETPDTLMIGETMNKKTKMEGFTYNKDITKQKQ